MIRSNVSIPVKEVVRNYPKARMLVGMMEVRLRQQVRDGMVPGFEYAIAADLSPIEAVKGIREQIEWRLRSRVLPTRAPANYLSALKKAAEQLDSPDFLRYIAGRLGAC